MQPPNPTIERTLRLRVLTGPPNIDNDIDATTPRQNIPLPGVHFRAESGCMLSRPLPHQIRMVTRVVRYPENDEHSHSRK
jgi:hypothetical protein